VFNTCSYVLGVGDRHLENFLFDYRQAIGRILVFGLELADNPQYGTKRWYDITSDQIGYGQSCPIGPKCQNLAHGRGCPLDDVG
jgi:hypothetical protein